MDDNNLVRPESPSTLPAPPVEGSTPETREAAVHAVVDAYATLEAANRRWPEILQLKQVRRRTREENNFGPKVKAMLET